MPRYSQPISLPRALEMVAAASKPLQVEEVPLAQALGRVLARPVLAGTDVPPFAGSAMDGFALRHGGAERRLAIIGESRAGAPARVEVAEGDAVRISTGAAMPMGADAVAPLEICTEDGAGGVQVHESLVAGRNVREAGEDMRAGSVALSAGERVGAVELAVVAGAGAGQVQCTRRPRVAVLTTGDELRPPGSRLAPGEIHNSNALSLGGLALEAGAEVLAAAHAGDNAGETRERLAELLSQADVVLVAGGVSVGPHDHVKQALAELGCRERFWGISIRPGKPTWFGESEHGLVFGLPGNPVSAIVIFMLLVRPALAALQGARLTAPDPLLAQLGESLPRDPRRTQAVRVRLTHDEDHRLRAWPTGEQGSHVTTSMLGADALALIAPGTGAAAAGEAVEAIPIR